MNTHRYVLGNWDFKVEDNIFIFILIVSVVVVVVVVEPFVHFHVLLM